MSFGGGVSLGGGVDLGIDAGLELGAFAGLKAPKLSAGAKLGAGLGDLKDLADSFGGGADGEGAGLPTIFSEKAKIAEKKIDLAELLFGEDEA